MIRYLFFGQVDFTIHFVPMTTAVQAVVIEVSDLRYLTDNERNQAYRRISTGQLHTLLRFHIQPINVVVYNGSQGKSSFEGGFPLRCFQRLSCPNVATLLCRWRDNRSTRGSSTPVLSY